MSKSNGSEEVTVHCLYDEMVEANTLVPHPRNPNTHGDSQIALLSKLIEYHGWRAPVVISKLTGYVVSGHGRLKAALGLPDTRVPIVKQEFANEDDELAHLVADNQISELSRWDNSKLKDLLDELNSGEVDLEVAGFSSQEFNSLLEEMGMNIEPHSSVTNLTEGDMERTLGKLEGRFESRQEEEIRLMVNVTCPHCAGEFSLKKSEFMERKDWNA